MTSVARLSPLIKYCNIVIKRPVCSSICLTKYTTPPKNDNLNQLAFTQQKFFSSESSEPKKEDGYFTKIMKNAFAPQLRRANLKYAGFLHYENIVDVINYSEWFKKYDLSDTFMSWFLITELHVWMLMVRCMAEGTEGRALRNHIVESLWNDVSMRINKLGVRNASRKKKDSEILSQQFQAALLGYDEGLLSNDMVLAGAVWRRFFTMTCDDASKIENIVEYIRKQTIILDKIPKETFFLTAKSIVWTTPSKIN